MALLRYRALTRAGAREAGTVDAVSPEAATAILASRGLIVLDVAQGDAGGAAWGRHPSRGDLAEFTRALAALLPAGLPLARALAIARDIAPRSMHATLHDVHQRVERGASFADALSAHPRVFPATYAGLVRAGEHAGSLPASIARLADAVEADEQLRARLFTAAIYPVLLAVVGSGAILVLLLVVLPRFGALFASSGSALPASTAFVLALSAWLRANATVLAAPALVVVGAGAWVFTAADAAPARSRLLLALPGISGVYRDAVAARASRLVAILLEGGATFVVALDDAARSIGDAHARDELLRIRARAREGVSPAAAIAEGTLFPPVLARLVAAGEESSQLPTFFARAADLFEERTSRAAARLVAVAEPALIVTFGVVVGLIALALVQAIYGINLAPMRAVRP